MMSMRVNLCWGWECHEGRVRVCEDQRVCVVVWEGYWVCGMDREEECRIIVGMLYVFV